MGKLKEENEDIEFVFVYTKEAHPDDAPEQPGPGMEFGGWRMKNNKIKIKTHTSYDERIEAAKQIREAGKSGWTIFVDDMTSTIQQTWGKLPNSAILVGPDGRVVHKWPWVRMMFQPIPKKYLNGQEKNKLAREVLAEIKERKAYSAGDDPLLALRDTVDGEWMTYTSGDTETIVSYDKASKASVSRISGETSETIGLKPFVLSGEVVKTRTESFTIKDVTLPCIIVSAEGRETWYSLWLPGDAIVKVIENGTVTRELKDAGFKKGESCLVPFNADKRTEEEKKRDAARAEKEAEEEKAAEESDKTDPNEDDF
ncbi:MAG: hypothetical protein HUU29_10495 [Planctomycetaceae bacterium]|nr:hypothetical protein [Planctomycetaceae bacterium]